jgi:methionyl-tRNA formyltransferase
MKIVVFCSHFLATSALQELYLRQELTGMVIPQSHALTEYFSIFAKERKIPLLLVNKEELQSEETNSWLEKQQVEAVFVITFPFKIPETLLEIPQCGFLNFHTGKLPQYRGLEPTFWELKKQEKTTAVTVIQMDKGWDSGAILHQQEIPISDSDTYGSLINKYSMVIQQLVSSLIQCFQENKSFPIPQIQEEASAKYYSRPTESDFGINWKEHSAKEVHHLIRACNPNCGGAKASFRGIHINILASSIKSPVNPIELHPGTIVTTDNDSGFLIFCTDGNLLCLDIIQVQEGVLSGKQFIDLFQVTPGELLGDLLEV